MTMLSARFVVSCEPNPATQVRVTEAMQVKGYAALEAADSTIQQ